MKNKYYNRKHFFHLVDASPWPFLVSMVMLVVAISLALSFHYEDAWFFWDIIGFSDESLKATLYKHRFSLFKPLSLSEFSFLTAYDLRSTELSQWVELFNFLYYVMDLSPENCFEVIYKLFFDKFGSNSADKLINHIYYGVHIKNTYFYNLLPLIWVKYLGDIYFSFVFHWRYKLTIYLKWYFYDFFFYYWIIFFVLLFLPLYFWLRDVVVEGTYLGHHTKNVKNLLRQGFLLFIVSEVMFFFSFFWAFFHSSFSPAFQIGGLWPPSNIVTPYCWDLPLSNTILLLVSGAWVTAAHHMLLDSNNLRRKDDDFYIFLLNKGFFGKIFAFLRHTFGIISLFYFFKKIIFLFLGLFLNMPRYKSLILRTELIYLYLFRILYIKKYIKKEKIKRLNLWRESYFGTRGERGVLKATHNFICGTILSEYLANFVYREVMKWRLPSAFFTRDWLPVQEHIKWFYWTRFCLFRERLFYRFRRVKLFSYMSKMIKDNKTLNRLPLMIKYHVIVLPEIYRYPAKKLFRYDENGKLIRPKLPIREDLSDIENTHAKNNILFDLPSKHVFSFRSLWFKFFYLLYNDTQVFNFHHLLGFYNTRIRFLDIYSEYFWFASYTFSAYYWKVIWRAIKILFSRVFYFIHVFLFKNKPKTLRDYLLERVLNDSFVNYWTIKFIELDKNGGLMQLFWRLNFFYEFPYRYGFKPEDAYKLANSIRDWLSEQVMDFYYLSTTYKPFSIYYSQHYFDADKNPALLERYEWGRNEFFYEYDIKVISLQKNVEIKHHQMRFDWKISSNLKIKDYHYNYNMIWKSYHLYKVKKFLGFLRYVYKKTKLFLQGDLVFTSKAYETYILPRPVKRLKLTTEEINKWQWRYIRLNTINMLLDNSFFYSIEVIVLYFYEQYFCNEKLRSLWSSFFFPGLTYRNLFFKESNFIKDSLYADDSLSNALDLGSNDFSEFYLAKPRDVLNNIIHSFLNEKGMMLAAECVEEKLTVAKYYVLEESPLTENKVDNIARAVEGGFVPQSELDLLENLDDLEIQYDRVDFDEAQKYFDRISKHITYDQPEPYVHFNILVIKDYFMHLRNLVWIGRLYAVSLRTVKREMVDVFLACTLFCGVAFLFCQIVEYYENLFDITDSVYGSTFYIMTGFHGLHVLAGMIFLVVVKWRNLLGHFTKRHHIGFTLAIWYWHFVDIVWVLLFLVVYIWGS